MDKSKPAVGQTRDPQMTFRIVIPIHLPSLSSILLRRIRRDCRHHGGSGILKTLIERRGRRSAVLMFPDLLRIAEGKEAS